MWRPLLTLAFPASSAARRRFGSAFVVIALASSPAALASGDAGGSPSAVGGARVVARVGKRTVTVADLETRLAELPAFQLATFGATPDQIRRRFLDEIVLPELLYAQAAEDRRLDHELPTEDLIARARSNATIRRIRRDAPGPAEVKREDIAAYYERHKDLYDAPERVQVWRILVASRSEAVDILARTKKDPSVKAFGDLAREKSLDRATHMRRGDLGFLSADGKSDEAALTVDPAIATAARSVKDGELVPEPVAEGPNFAVVWRRGTTPARSRPLAQVEEAIRDALHREAVERATRERIAELRKAQVRDLDPAPIRLLEIKVDDGSLGPRRKGLEDAGRGPG